MTGPAVSVIIPTKQRAEVLRRSLAAVEKAAAAAGRPVEVLVLDDGDEDATARVVAEAERHGTSATYAYVASREYGGRGQGDARNEGARRARAPVLAFTDDDTECSEEWLNRALHRLDEEPHIAGIEGQVTPRPLARFDPAKARVVQNLDGGAFLTANLILRRDAFFEAGGVQRLRTDAPARWDHSFREDTDLALRVEEAVAPVPFDPSVAVEHPFEEVTLERYLRTAAFFEVDEAFSALHPGAFPRLLARPLARLRIRASCLAVAAIPLLAIRRARLLGLAALGGAVAAQHLQAERDLRLAGVARPPLAVLRDGLRRTPRAAAWTLVAGAARLAGIVEVRLAGVPLRPDPAPPLRADAPGAPPAPEAAREATSQSR